MKRLIAGNWKMNKTLGEGLSYVKEFKEYAKSFDNEVMLFVPYIMLKELNQEVKGTKVRIGSQNVSQHLSGAYTGEVSVTMLKDLGIDLVLLGHSERREYYAETNSTINDKLKTVLANDMQAVVCLGETLDEYEAGQTNAVLECQLKKMFDCIDANDMKNVVIAYEPVWAIGTGKTASAEVANNSCAFIRGVMEGIFNTEIANDLVIQYGGSVNVDNVEELMNQSDINGALVGGASLDAAAFKLLIK